MYGMMPYIYNGARGREIDLLLLPENRRDVQKQNVTWIGERTRNRILLPLESEYLPLLRENANGCY